MEFGLLVLWPTATDPVSLENHWLAWRLRNRSDDHFDRCMGFPGLDGLSVVRPGMEADQQLLDSSGFCHNDANSVVGSIRTVRVASAKRSRGIDGCSYTFRAGRDE
jgi:hypothetical protein